ncbi:MAG: hypothetical protein J3K34DRAFT_390459 [Monoraphidium minutum]|nr:MAG: hypothetical protein J3K34DRAFT_390459 [Monoraphidium minutum]
MAEDPSPLWPFGVGAPAPRGAGAAPALAAAARGAPPAPLPPHDVAEHVLRFITSAGPNAARELRLVNRAAVAAVDAHTRSLGGIRGVSGIDALAAAAAAGRFPMLRGLGLDLYLECAAAAFDAALPALAAALPGLAQLTFDLGNVADFPQIGDVPALMPALKELHVFANGTNYLPPILVAATRLRGLEGLVIALGGPGRDDDDRGGCGPLPPEGWPRLQVRVQMRWPDGRRRAPSQVLGVEARGGKATPPTWLWTNRLPLPCPCHLQSCAPFQASELHFHPHPAPPPRTRTTALP